MKLSKSPGHKLVSCHRAPGCIPSSTWTHPVTTHLLWDITLMPWMALQTPTVCPSPLQLQGPSLLPSAAWVGYAWSVLMPAPHFEEHDHMCVCLRAFSQSIREQLPSRVIKTDHYNSTQ